MQSDNATVTSIEGPIHVSFKSVKNTVPPGRYKFQFADYNHATASTGTPGIRTRLVFDKTMHPDYEKRSVGDNLWLTPNAINMYLSFLIACGIKSELLTEEPIPGEFNPDGSPVTKCKYSVDDQLKSILATSVYADVEEEQYEGLAADGVTPETKWRNTIRPRGYSKV